jgi:hypothetical protein
MDSEGDERRVNPRRGKVASAQGPKHSSLVYRLLTAANWLFGGVDDGSWRIRAQRGFGEPQET